MALVRVFSPESQTEVALAQSLLEAHGIPVFVHGGNVGSLMPGLQINALNTQSIMVPEDRVAEALDLLTELRSGRAEPAPALLPWRDHLRVILEGLLMGWFVPGRSGRKTHAPRDDHDA